MANGILLIDKPQDFTSHDVVAKLRGMFHMRQIGHAGTLDPLATGLLIVLVGKATGVSDYAMAQHKEYIAHFKLGIMTDTQDISGGVTGKRPVTADREQVAQAVKGFIGTQLQKPPMYSAIQIGGKRLYDLARKGVEVERQSREITIEDIALTDSLGSDEYAVRVVCSKGTYIRTLCSDIGDKLGCGATMTALRRVKSGDFTVEMAKTLEQVQSCEDKQELLLPLDTVFDQYVKVTVNAEGAKRAANGAILLKQHLQHGALPEQQELVCVYDAQGSFLQLGIGGVSEFDQVGILCKKNFMVL